MSSILKVDTLQDSGGNAIITSNGSGTFTSSLPNTGITMADQWRLTADISSDINPISSNLERVDDTGFNYIGTGMTVSSGAWSFPETGIYLVRFYGLILTASINDSVFVRLRTTTDNSTYTDVSITGASANSNSHNSSMASEIFFDVTDTSTHKLKVQVSSISSGTVLRGDTSRNETSFTFIRLGDT